MDVLHARIAGIDVGKRELVVCVRLPPDRPGGERTEQIRSFGTTTRELLAVRDWLTGLNVTCAVLESTAQYWRGIFYVLEEVMDTVLVNPAHIKALPGRKSDVLDAAWICQMAELGLVKASFVAPEPIRRLRELTRYRAFLITDRGRFAQYLEQTLEDAQIKISSVLSKLFSASGRSILDALIAGERDPVVLANLARGRARVRIPELVEALDGRFTEHHAAQSRRILHLIDQLTVQENELTARIDELLEPWRRQIELLTTIPGIGGAAAAVIIAETGGEMSQFPTAGQLASWAGTTPGLYRSAGVSASSRTGPGNKHLAGALGLAAFCAGRSTYTYLGARYRMLAARIGAQRANVALQHDLLVVIWHMLTKDEPYKDPGGDYYDRKDPEAVRRRAVAQLQRLGHKVALSPAR